MTILPTAPTRGLVRSWLRESDTGLLALALGVGVGAAGLALVFRWLIATFTRLFTGYADYAAHPGAPHADLPGLGPWFVVLTPVLAGLVYGPLVYRFAPEARGHGVPEVMFAVSRRGGRIRPQVAGVKALASALCIGGGGSVGREGPIVQIGSALGSTLGRLGRLSESRMKVLVACGAASGIAATFNAPLAGVFFAMELILADFAAQAFGMVVVSAVTSAAIARAAIGDEVFLTLPIFTLAHHWEYLLVAALGLLAGGVGVGFTRVLYAIEDACDAVWRGPEWARPAVGGLLLGGLLLVLPQMYGVGYPVLGNAVDGAYAVGFLAVLLVGKVVATSLTIGIGGSGGVFAPSLFLGAMLGAGFGEVAGTLSGGAVAPVGAYALLGMGAVFAGSARAPITAVIILFELTGEYSIILPLMVAVVLATGLSHRLSADTVYTLKLRRRGVDLGRPSETILAVHRVGDLMLPVPRPVAEGDRLADVAHALAVAPGGVLPVVDAGGVFRGTLSARVVARTLAGESGHEVDPVSLVEETPELLRTDADVAAGLAALERSDASAVPVHGAADGPEADDVVGWLTYEATLGGRGRPR